MSATPKLSLPEMCIELQQLQRRRSVILKSRIMQANRLQAVVAGTLGYTSSMTENDRLKKFKEASIVIKAVADGDVSASTFAGIIQATLVGIDALDRHKKDLEREMVRLAKRLPVAAWVEKPEQRGFGLMFLAIVIGETGDLNNYANPAKVWRRLGCAPWTFAGKTAMGATWKAGKEGKLTADQWTAFGYSPRRRSIAFLIGEGIVKQNTLAGERSSVTERDTVSQDEHASGEAARVHEMLIATGKKKRADKREPETDTAHAGPFRKRYDDTKAIAQQKHPDWNPLRCHRHGMLLATKMLLKELWIAWRE